MDLITKNQEFLDKHVYKLADERQMLRLAALDSPNKYDLYLIACCICNYTSELTDEEKFEVRNLRMQLYLETNNGNIAGFEHKEEDYQSTKKTGLICKNTGKVNKYGHYEFELNTHDSHMISDLWDFKRERNCLKYVDAKSFPDKLIISITRDQFDDFCKLLDDLLIQYDKNDLSSGMYYVNKSTIELVDPKDLDLPFDVYPFQLEDAKKIIQYKRVLIGHEMGLGKTLISILVGSSLNVPKLVICPECLRINWEREIKQAKHDSDVQILYANEEPHFGKDWTIVGYKTAVKYIDELKKHCKCLFVDECHNCKAVNNWGKPTSKRAEAVINLAQASEYCYLLSGTPEPSHNIDLYNILKMLKCEEFDFNNKWAFLNYANKFCDPKETYFGKDFSGSSNTDQLHKILSKIMVRRLRKDVLPNLKKQRQFIPIKPAFKKDYTNIEKRLYKPLEGDTYMGLAMTGRQMLSKHKLDTAIDLAESLVNAGESVVLVTNFIETADELAKHFKNDCCEIRGGMSDLDKQIAIDMFQDKKKSVCILNMQAGGVGITLTAAHTMIIIDYAWLPSDMIQVEDRICRSGQTEACMIYYIYCENSILDEIFINMISEKSANIDAVIDDADSTFDLNKEKSENNTYLSILKSRILKRKETA